jgi:recombinational DNA repair protein (RecF pathway)
MCRDCVLQDEDYYRQIYEYILEHKDDRTTTVSEVSAALDIPEKIVFRLIKEGRFVTAGINWEVLECAKCGVPIAEGTYCKNCRESLAKGMQEMSKSLSKSAGIEMAAEIKSNAEVKQEKIDTAVKKFRDFYGRHQKDD